MAVPPFPVEQNYPDTIAGRPMKTYVDWIAPTFVWSMTGLPVASVPAGLDVRGLPAACRSSAPAERSACSRLPPRSSGAGPSEAGGRFRLKL